MKHPQLKAEERIVIGKKVKKLRREGTLPANVYGKGLSSTTIQVKTEDFITIYKEVGETGLIDLSLNGKTHPVLVKNTNFEFRYHQPLHVDFFQVNLKEKVKATISVVLIGEPKAVTEKLGTLLQTLNEVEVESLPEALPENIEVNIENLAEVDQQIMVSDLKTDEGVTILTEGDQVVAKIAELIVEEEPEPEPEVEGEASEAATEEGQEAGENTDSKDEKPSEEDKKEEASS